MSVIVQERTARKPHDCHWCGRYGIKPGDRYIRHAMTPNDAEFGNKHWLVLYGHPQDNYQCLAASGRL